MIVKLETKASSSTLSLLKSMPAHSKANGYIKELESLEIRIDTKSREKIITKLIKRKNHEDTNLMLVVSLLGRDIQVRIIDVGLKRVVYQYRYKDMGREYKQQSLNQLPECLSQAYSILFNQQIGDAAHNHYLKYFGGDQGI